MIDIEQAMKSPASVFETPEQVAAATELSTSQRRRILRQWSYDLRELLVASDENMASAGHDEADANAELLRRVDALLSDIDPDDDEHAAPTMQGGT